MDEEYIKKLEQENQLLHSQNEELLYEVSLIPDIREIIIQLKQKCNYYIESYKQTVKGNNQMIEYLKEGKSYRLDDSSLGGPMVKFKINENYEDCFRTEFPRVDDNQTEEITEEEVLTAGYKINPDKDCYYKGELENILTSASSAVAEGVNVIYPGEVKNSTLNTLQYGQVDAGYVDKFGNIIPYEPPPLPPLGFNVWPITKDTQNE